MNVTIDEIAAALLDADRTADLDLLRMGARHARNTPEEDLAEIQEAIATID